MRTLAVVSWVLMACGDSEPTPVEKCDELVDLVCDRFEECVSAAGTHADCVQLVQQQVPCGTAKAVSASYDRCMAQLASFSCANLFPAGSLRLPADCNGVVLH